MFTSKTVCELFFCARENTRPSILCMYPTRRINSLGLLLRLTSRIISVDISLYSHRILMHGRSHRQPNIRPRLLLHLRLCHRCFWLKKEYKLWFPIDEFQTDASLPSFSRVNSMLLGIFRYSRRIRLLGRPTTAVRKKPYCKATILSTVPAGEIFYRILHCCGGRFR